MARLVRGCLVPWPQQGGTEEPQINISVPQQEGQAEATGGKVVADYNLDVDYKPEGSDLEIKAVDDKEEENSDAEYAKMQLRQDETLPQRTMNCKVAERIEHTHQVQGPEVIASSLHDMSDCTVQRGSDYPLTNMLMTSVMS